MNATNKTNRMMKSNLDETMVMRLAELKDEENCLLRMLPKVAQQPRAMHLAFAAAVKNLEQKTNALQNSLLAA